MREVGEQVETPTRPFTYSYGLAHHASALARHLVVTPAEHLARRLGNPYGTLVLSLSIVVIEVLLISAVMLRPGEHATIARDSVMAVSMIILNLVVGVALVVGGFRYSNLKPNRAGVSSYLSLLVVLLGTAFALPGLIGTDGAYSPG